MYSIEKNKVAIYLINLSLSFDDWDDKTKLIRINDILNLYME